MLEQFLLLDYESAKYPTFTTPEFKQRKKNNMEKQTFSLI